MTEYVTSMKVLNEKIIVTKVKLTRNKRMIIGLMMKLSERFESLNRLWSLMSDLTAEKDRNMLLEEDRRQNSKANEFGSDLEVYRGYRVNIKEEGSFNETGKVRSYSSGPQLLPKASEPTSGMHMHIPCALTSILRPPVGFKFTNIRCV